MDALIDTGSDISLMRAEQYVRVGAPKLGKKTIRFRGIGDLMKDELILGTDFLNTVQSTMSGEKVTIRALKSIPEDEEIRGVCRLDVVQDEVTIIDETHVLKTEHQDTAENLIDEHGSEKTSCELEMLTMEEAQRDEADTGRIVDFIEKRGINGDVAKGVMPSGETDSDMRIVVPVALKPGVIRQTHGREKHCSVAGTKASLNEECQNRSIRDEIQKKKNRREYNRKRKKASTYREKDLVAIKRAQQGPGLKLANKYLDPYEIVRILRNNRYIIRKVGDHKGPWETSTAANYIKPWASEIDNPLDKEELRE
ncbi:hypothetical protein HN011_000297 [Eciton burchellii]|nr:hypothetical protein HN011_000297 [Eciton burchellii]